MFIQGLLKSVNELWQVYCEKYTKLIRGIQAFSMILALALPKLFENVQEINIPWYLSVMLAFLILLIITILTAHELRLKKDEAINNITLEKDELERKIQDEKNAKPNIVYDSVISAASLGVAESASMDALYKAISFKNEPKIKNESSNANNLAAHYICVRLDDLVENAQRYRGQFIWPHARENKTHGELSSNGTPQNLIIFRLGESGSFIDVHLYDSEKYSKDILKQTQTVDRKLISLDCRYLLAIKFQDSSGYESTYRCFLIYSVTGIDVEIEPIHGPDLGGFQTLEDAIAHLETAND